MRAGEVSRGSRSRTGLFSLCRGDKFWIFWSLEAVVSRWTSGSTIGGRVRSGEAPVAWPSWALNLQLVDVRA